MLVKNGNVQASGWKYKLQCLLHKTTMHDYIWYDKIQPTILSGSGEIYDETRTLHKFAYEDIKKNK